MIGGASTAQPSLNAGLADELPIDTMPVLLGNGLRPSDGIAAEPVKLERIRGMELPGGRRHLRFGVGT
jgi:hypothetical protein